MKRVYVAGAIKAEHHFEFLRNVSRGIYYGIKILKMGYAPFVPHLDFMFLIKADESDNITIESFYGYSMAWLEGSQAVFVCPKSENSTGTQNEIKRANELSIPVFYNLNDLIEWGKE